MFHRLTAMLIVIFWLCMTGLLVVREMYPEVTRLNDVPVSYVSQIIFQHEQLTDLRIYEGGKDVGSLLVQPKRRSTDGALTLEYHGSLNVALMGGARQTLSWLGSLEMNSAYRVQKLHFNLAFQQGDGQIDVLVEPPKNVARYTIKTGKNTVEAGELSLDEAGITGLLTKSGLGVGALTQAKAAGMQMSAPQFSAQTSSLSINGETVSTYYYVMKIEGQKVIEAHLSQLGQVLRAHIPLLGYKLAPANISPSD